MLIQLLRFLSIIFTAILAGTSFGIWMGFDPSSFSASTYIEQQQHLVRSLNTLMIALVFMATVVTLISAILQRKNKSTFIALLIAVVFFIACIVITRFGNVPIQKEMLSWTVDSMPNNWEQLRDKWWNYHIMRTISELIALVLISWTLVQTRIPHPNG